MIRSNKSGRTVTRLAPTPWTAIIPLELGERIHELAEEKYSPNSDQSFYRYILSGLILCPLCGNKMMIRNEVGENDRELRCLKRTRTGDCSFDVGMPASRIEQVTLEGLANVLTDPTFDERYAADMMANSEATASQLEAKAKLSEREIERAERKLERLVDLFTEDEEGFSDDGLMLFKNKKRKQISEQADKLAQLKRKHRLLTRVSPISRNVQDTLSFAGRLREVASAGLFRADTLDQQLFRDKVRELIKQVRLVTLPGDNYDIVCTFDFGPMFERGSEAIVAELTFPLEIWRATNNFGIFNRAGLVAEQFALTDAEFSCLKELEGVKKLLGNLDESERRPVVDILTRASCFDLRLAAGAEFYGLHYPRLVDLTYKFRTTAALQEFINALQELRPGMDVRPRKLAAREIVKPLRSLFERVNHPVLRLSRCQEELVRPLSPEEVRIIVEQVNAGNFRIKARTAADVIEKFFEVISRNITFDRLPSLYDGYKAKYARERLYFMIDSGLFNRIVAALLALEGLTPGIPGRYPEIPRYKRPSEKRLRKVRNSKL